MDCIKADFSCPSISFFQTVQAFSFGENLELLSRQKCEKGIS
ncbi:hypothetical protein LEP1GSC193_3613 [Leptospira alstonii serovar Pingchang str. 80-412]|uniref:Uncharacterized protein n=2 Tax=Leptospira alstonii TaxID=28452 RepID=M6CSG0_9LEPT|nr:hypothetical protein LEP1GSC194_0749 [Leptospira alstonii serovar Sichuan str. 79601]EQA81167.1 hypothetical protein LEP1GSC193_3613 [Leptospira alstonii serovar Pingchang str. 80-412]